MSKTHASYNADRITYAPAILAPRAMAIPRYQTARAALAAPLHAELVPSCTR
jgi:hypothetical protein